MNFDEFIKRQRLNLTAHNYSGYREYSEKQYITLLQSIEYYLDSQCDKRELAEDTLLEISKELINLKERGFEKVYNYFFNSQILPKFTQLRDSTLLDEIWKKHRLVG